jgi:hypothetical protein
VCARPRARSWTDDAEDLPLLFSFGYVDAEGMAHTVTSATTASSIAGLVLPIGDLDMGVVVADQLGATATAFGASKLSVATPTLNVAAVNGLLASTDEILKSGNPEAAQRLLVGLAKYAKDSSRRRRRLQATSAAAAAFNTTQIAGMLTSAESAAALSDGSAEARQQSAGVLTAPGAVAADGDDAGRAPIGLPALHECG